MSSVRRTIFIISADALVAQACIDELAAFGEHYRTPVVNSVEKARKAFVRSPPSVVFLDQSAVDSMRHGDALESDVASLSEIAPVVVSAAPEKQGGLAFLITAGAVDFVSRTGHFCPLLRACWTAGCASPNASRE
jgi:DNA-binding NtrC family response regulator